jgi:hypothetical protein
MAMEASMSRTVSMLFSTRRCIVASAAKVIIFLVAESITADALFNLFIFIDMDLISPNYRTSR